MADEIKLLKCDMTESIIDPNTGKERKCYRCYRPDLVLLFPDLYEGIEYRDDPSKVARIVYEALAAMIMKESNNLSKGKSPDLPDIGFPFTTVYDLSWIYFTYHLDKQGRVCSEKDPDAFMSITLAFEVAYGNDDEMPDEISDTTNFNSYYFGSLLKENEIGDYGPIYDHDDLPDEYDEYDEGESYNFL